MAPAAVSPPLFGDCGIDYQQVVLWSPRGGQGGGLGCTGRAGDFGGHEGPIRDGGGSWAHIQWVSPSLMSGGSPPFYPFGAQQWGHNSQHCRLWYYKLQVTSVCVVCI